MYTTQDYGITYISHRHTIAWVYVLCCSGQPCRFVVVTTGAGCGTLAVMMEGPAKVAVVCSEVDDGYEFSYTPTAPGDYFINIKYCNVTIAGCPHKAVVSGDSKL